MFMFNNFINSEVVVYCVVSHSNYCVYFKGILVSENEETITLNSAVDFAQPHRKMKSLIVKKDTIVSIGQL